MVVSLRIEEDLRAVRFFDALTSISTVTCSFSRFDASRGVSGMAVSSAGDSMLGQEDRQQQRGVFNPLDRVRLPCGQVEELTGFKVLCLAEGGEGHLSLQAMHDDFALGPVLR